MNISHLHFIRAVAETHSFSKAAVLCHVTQPTLSNGIASLEEEFGGKLFDRTTRSVHLTPMGTHLLPYIERALIDLDEIVSVASAWKDPKHKLIRIGVSPVVNMTLLLDVLADFRAKHTDVEFFFKECFLDDLSERLNAGQLDMLVLPREAAPDHCKRLDLYTEPLCYLFRNGDNFESGASSVTLEEAAKGTLIMSADVCGLHGVTNALFKDTGYKIDSYPGLATSYAAIEEWASLGIGAGILPSSKISPQCSNFVPIVTRKNRPATISCQLAWRAELLTTTHAKALVRYLRNRLAN